MHLNLTEPLQRRWTLLQWEGWVCGGVQTATRSQSLHSAAAQAQNCSTFITAAGVQEAAWLVARARRSKVLRAKKLHHVLPRSYSKQVKLLPPPLSGKQHKSSVILKLTWSSELEANTYIQLGTGFHRKIMCLSNSLRTVIARSECKEAQFNMTLTFLAGGIIKTVPSLYFPHGSVALTPNCFSIKLKALQRASATVSNTAARTLKDCQSIIPLVKNFTKGLNRPCLSCVITNSTGHILRRTHLVHDNKADVRGGGGPHHNLMLTQTSICYFILLFFCVCKSINLTTEPQSSTILFIEQSREAKWAYWNNEQAHTTSDTDSQDFSPLWREQTRRWNF